MNIYSCQNESDWERYIRFAETVYKDNPYWVPTEDSHFMSFFKGETPFNADSQWQAFWVEAGGEIVATLTAFVQKAYNDHWHEKTGHLLFFEALPNRPDEVRSLFETAIDWLRSAGCDLARCSFFYGLEFPLSLDAYDQVPSLFHRYNPPYYHAYLKDSGFYSDRGAIEYRFELTSELGERYRRITEETRAAGVTTRYWNLDDLEAENERFGALVKTSFSRHWGCPPNGPRELRDLTVGMKDFIIPELTGFAEVDGQIAGCVFGLPDLNQVGHALRHATAPPTESEIGALFEKIDHGFLLIIGVDSTFRGKRISSALGASLFSGMIEKGFKTAGYTIVLDENWASRRTAARLGGYPERNYLIYEKKLA